MNTKAKFQAGHLITSADMLLNCLENNKSIWVTVWGKGGRPSSSAFIMSMRFRTVMQFLEADRFCACEKREDICSICGGDHEPIYENNGFNKPDPTHYEIIGYKPCKCQEDL